MSETWIHHHDGVWENTPVYSVLFKTREHMRSAQYNDVGLLVCPLLLSRQPYVSWLKKTQKRLSPISDPLPHLFTHIKIRFHIQFQDKPRHVFHLMRIPTSCYSSPTDDLFPRSVFPVSSSSHAVLHRYNSKRWKGTCSWVKVYAVTHTHTQCTKPSKLKRDKAKKKQKVLFFQVVGMRHGATSLQRAVSANHFHPLELLLPLFWCGQQFINQTFLFPLGTYTCSINLMHSRHRCYVLRYYSG